MKLPTLLRRALFLLIGTLLGCAGEKEAALLGEKAAMRPESVMQVAGLWEMPDFSDDLTDTGLKEAIQQSLVYYSRVGEEKALRFGDEVYKVKDIQHALQQFVVLISTTPPGKDRKKAIRELFRVYRAGGTKKVLFTGYYEPVLRGSRVRNAENQVPLYGVPSDLVVVELGLFRSDLKGITIVGRYDHGRLVPYYTRHEIDRLGLLEDRGLDIAWVADPVEAFFLHIQGSGRILLPDGRYMAVHYAGSNGRPYRSIGKLLIETNEIPKGKGSLAGIVEYLHKHPDGRDAILDYNERYVFFQETEGGPAGNLNVLLTSGRSLATDQQLYPPGALVYIETEVPRVDASGRLLEWESIGRFMLNQDVGGAIRGPNRADIYWGSGEDAGAQAGSMYREGQLYFLAPSPK